MNKPAYVIWFTGLSGSGKSTLAHRLLTLFKKNRLRTKIIDGDEIRATFKKQLGFTRDDVIENNKRIIKLCESFRKVYDVLLVPVISPLQETRDFARKKFGKKYIEVYVRASIEECIKRDVKGLYKKALNGEIKNFIGLESGVQYEDPKNSEITVNSDDMSIDQSVILCSSYLKNKGILL